MMNLFNLFKRFVIAQETMVQQHDTILRHWEQNLKHSAESLAISRRHLEMAEQRRAEEREAALHAHIDSLVDKVKAGTLSVTDAVALADKPK